MKEVGYYQSS